MDCLRSRLFCIFLERRSPWDEAKLGEVLAVTVAIFDKLLKMRNTGETFPRRRDLPCLQSSLKFQKPPEALHIRLLIRNQRFLGTRGQKPF